MGPLHMHQPHCRVETLATLLAQTPEKQKHETGKPANRQTAKSRDRSAHRRFFFYAQKSAGHGPYTCTNHTVEGRHWRHSWPNPSEKQKHENGKPPNRKVQRQKREAPIFFYAQK